MFLQHLVCVNDQNCSCGLKSNASFDSDDGVSDVHVASDAVLTSNAVDFIDSRNFVFILLSIDGNQFAFLEINGQLAFVLANYLAWIRLFRKCFIALQRFLSTNGCAPKSFVDGVLEFLEIGFISVFLQIVDFIFTREFHVTGWSNNLNFRSKNLECKVETHLVVPGSCGTMSHGIGTYLLGIVDDGNSLENTLRRDGNRICPVAKHVPKNHVANTLGVVVFRDIKCNVTLHAKALGLVGDDF